MRRIAPSLQELLNVRSLQQRSLRLRFQDSGMQFIVVGEWEPGTHCPGATSCDGGKIAARACGLNDHSILTVRRDGTDWVIDVPLRPGDGSSGIERN